MRLRCNGALLNVAVALTAACTPFGAETSDGGATTPVDGGRVDAAEGGSAVPSVCYALELDGLADYVEVPDAADLDPTGSSTVEAWVLLTKRSSPELHVVSHHDHDGRRGYLLMAYGYAASGPNPPELGGSARYYDGQSQNQIGFGGASRLTLDRWTHLAVSYDGAAMHLYVDGVKRAEKGAFPRHPNADFAGVLHIGRNALADNFHWGGRIDEVRISSVARYTADAFTPARRFDLDGSTIALWHLDEGEGSVAQDATGKHAGVIHGAAWVEAPCAGP